MRTLELSLGALNYHQRFEQQGQPECKSPCTQLDESVVNAKENGEPRILRDRQLSKVLLALGRKKNGKKLL